MSEKLPEKEARQAVFYLVASPIGQSQDLSQRAIETIGSADIIFCEDKRVTGLLLSSLKLKKKLVSCNSHTEKRLSEYLLICLSEQKKVAYLSDAGTPGISDPGNFLVKSAQENGFRVIPIPGPSALSAILSVCSFDLSKGFFFEGFLPKSSIKIRKIFQVNLLERKNILVFFESPYRIKKTLLILKEAVADSRVCLARELTKKYEQIFYFTAKDLEKLVLKEKGEFSLVVSPALK